MIIKKKSKARATVAALKKEAWVVMPADAGIRKSLNILDSGARFVCPK